MTNHVGTEDLVINCGSVQRVFPEEIVVEGQMSQHDRDAAFQREASIRVPSLGKSSVQVGQGIEMRTESGDESSRPLKPER